MRNAERLALGLRSWTDHDGGGGSPTHGWRTRIAVASLLRELRLVAGEGVAAPGRVCPPTLRSWLRHAARRVVGLLRAPGRRRRARPALGTWWSTIPDPATATIPRQPLGRTRLVAQAAAVERRTELELADVEAVLPMLGDIRAEELEVALRVVRRMRGLVSAA